MSSPPMLERRIPGESLHPMLRAVGVARVTYAEPETLVRVLEGLRGLYLGRHRQEPDKDVTSH